jgi:hypothetical protein
MAPPARAGVPTKQSLSRCGGLLTCTATNAVRRKCRAKSKSALAMTGDNYENLHIPQIHSR